jgi:hypothetical protein
VNTGKNVEADSELTVLDRNFAMQPSEADIILLESIEKSRSWILKPVRFFFLGSPFVLSLHGRLKFMLWTIIFPAFFILIDQAFVSASVQEVNECPRLNDGAFSECYIYGRWIKHGDLGQTPQINCSQPFTEPRVLLCYEKLYTGPTSLAQAIATAASLLRLVLAGVPTYLAEFLAARFRGNAPRIRKVPILVWIFSATLLILLMILWATGFLPISATYLLVLVFLTTFNLTNVFEILAISTILRPTPDERLRLNEVQSFKELAVQQNVTRES